MFARHVQASVYVSQDLRTRVGLPGKIIYNPVSLVTRSKLPAEDESDVIAFAGRLVREKGLGILLRAMQSVPDARLRIAGDGPLRARLERLAFDLGIMSRTSFLGELLDQELVDLFAASTVVCVPSVWVEAFGYAAAEAMALGRPVVGLPTGALPELLAEGRGFLADDSTPPALAAALRTALESEVARRQVGEAARDFAYRWFHPDVVGARYLEVYQA